MRRIVGRFLPAGGPGIPVVPAGLALALLAAAAAGQESPLPRGDRKPVLHLDPGGPAAAVTALAVGADGRTLFAAGLDKTVRVYRERGGRWEPGPPLRVPVGPGNAGAVNALAASADGRWLAAAGRGPMRDEAGFAAGGVVIAADRRSDAMRRDLGVIYLFDLANPAGGRILRGHRAEVRGLAFAAGTANPVLVSAAAEPGSDGKPTGVVRVWDAAAGAELAARTGFPPTLTRMGLAGWPTGAGKKDLAVAVAWPEPDPAAGGRLRLWDVARDAVTEHADGAFNRAVAVLPGADGKPARVVTGGFANFGVVGAVQQGQVAVRDLTGGNARAIGFPPVGGTHFLPLAAAPAGAAVALLLERSGAAAAARPTDLTLIDPDTGGLVATLGLTGVDPTYLPVLAAAPKGDVLAVAGFRDNRVEVYAAADLRAGRAAPAVLRGGPAGFAGVRFLAGGTAVGLAPADGPGLMFDFATRALGPDDGTRPVDAPAAAGVGFEPVAPAAGEAVHVVRVTANGAVVTCRLIPGAVPTAWAYLPGRPGWMPGLGPLVAIAHDEPDQAKALITLFDGTTGRPLRQLTGHLRPVRGLAFSAARPLLASVAADGTACVWSLKDLDREPGTVDGLDLVERDGVVAVETVAPPLGRLLAPGDVIEAVGGGAKPDPVRTVADFVWRAAAVAPGGTLPVRVRGKNAAVVLPVTRGVDERKPLFTLWVGPPAAGGRDWVGWSPAGPYDASGSAAEAAIGWLTNTGDPKAPVTFAGADEYRDTYYRKGLLGALAERAELAAALDRVEELLAPPPRVAVRAPEATGGAVRFGKAVLRVDLENVAPGFPLDRAELRYRVRPPGGEAPAWVTVPAAGPRPWAFDLPAAGWVRGEYTAEVELLRRPGGPVADRQAVTFLAAPPPPALAVTAGGVTIDPDTPPEKRTVSVKRPALPLAVRATGFGREPVAVTVHDGAGERPLAAAADGSFPAIELTLKPGDTTVRVRAVPAAATAATRAAETAELAVAVRYDPPAPEPTPTISPVTFTPAGVPFRLGDADVVAVDGPEATASARVTAPNPLTAVAVTVGGGKPESFDAGGTKDFTARRRLVLKPGEPVRVLVTAATANSPSGERSAVVAYLPVPPAVAVAPPLPASVTVPKLTVTGTLGPIADGVPVTVRVAVAAPGREPRTFDAKVDAAARTWTAEVELFPGPNRLSVTARNAWREGRTETAAVAYRRPPRIVSAKEADAGTTAVADLALTVESADGLAPRELLVDGRPVSMAARKTAAAGDRVTWEVTARAVPVKGEAGWLERLSVVVRNDDGDSAPVAVAVKRTAPPPVAAPRIALRDVPRDAAVEDATVAVRFRVTSAAPLLRVEVWHRAGAADEYEKLAGFAPGEPVKDGDGFALDATATVPLAEGANRVRVVAANDGGETREEFAVARTVPPVQVVVEGLDELTPPGGAARPLRPVGDDGRPRFEPARSGFVVVHGYVRWARPDDPALADPGLAAAVAVNGVDHLPAPLGPAGQGVRRFRAPLFLNGPDNTVRLAVRAGGRDRAVPQAAAGARAFRVGCAAPLARQRLHVVVVGVDVPDGDRPGLVRRVVAALGGVAKGRFEAGVFEAPGFERAVLYPPVLGEVQSGDVRWALADVADRIRGLAAVAPPDDWVNDVVLVYYQGRDWVDDRDGRRWLHTSRSLRYPPAVWREHAVAVDRLPASAGVRLLLLSVVDPEGRPSTAARDPGVAVLRYAWADPAAPARILPAFGQALAARVRLGDVVADTTRRFRGDPAAAGEPVERVPEDVRDRPLGRGRQ